MPMHNLIVYSDNYSKKAESLWQYCKDIPAVNNNGAIVDFNEAKVIDLLNFKEKIADQARNDRIKDVKIMVKIYLKYLSNFWKTLETP